MSAFLILHDIRSVLNVGALFRTADAVGVSRVYCTGYTSTPTDRFGRIRDDIAKAALGAETYVPWEHCADVAVLIKKLKAQGVQVIALEQSEKSIDYKIFKPACDFAMIVGNERDGIPKEVIDLADVAVFIPMKGKKESLNVATSAGVALFRLLDI